MVANPVAKRPPPLGFAILCVLGCLLYFGMIACLSDLQGSDAFGRGLASAFAAMFGLGLWIVLGALLLIGGAKGAMPYAAGIAAIVLLPFSAFAAGIAAEFIHEQAAWLLIPALLPPVIAVYAAWARLPGTHAALPPTATSIAMWSAIVLLTLAPMPRYVAEQTARATQRREARQEEQRRDAATEQKRRDTRARFDKLTADSPLWEWAEFFGPDSELDRQAIEVARLLSHKQDDAVDALRRGMGFPLVEYERLDLEATPALCQAATDYLRGQADAHPPPATEPDAAYSVIRTNFSPYLEAIEWLTQKDCGIDDAVARITAVVSAYPASTSRDGFLGVLAWGRGNGFYKRNDYARALAAYNDAIRVSADNAQFYYFRGRVYFDTGNSDAAITDYGEALRLNSGYSAVFYSRANAFRVKGEADRAIADYDEFIRLTPKSAAAYNNRGFVYYTKGEHIRAIHDFDDALELSPQLRLALDNRARARFFATAYTEAVADFAAALQLKPDDAYTALWLYLARSQAGEPTPDALRRDAAGLDHDAWPSPLISFFLGESDRAAVRTAAGEGEAETKQSQECEAAFFLGADAAGKGELATAHDLLQQARSLCGAGTVEQIAAGFELARLLP